MQISIPIITLAVSVASVLAAPNNVKRTSYYCPSTVYITGYGAADAYNNYDGIADNAYGGWVALSGGPNPELSSSEVSWSSMDIVTCVFQGVDSINNAGPVLSNRLPNGNYQVGPPQTLTYAQCTC